MDERRRHVEQHGYGRYDRRLQELQLCIRLLRGRMDAHNEAETAGW
jgi:hypothetical protein